MLLNSDREIRHYFSTHGYSSLASSHQLELECHCMPLPLQAMHTHYNTWLGVVYAGLDHENFVHKNLLLSRIWQKHEIFNPKLLGYAVYGSRNNRHNVHS